MDSARRGSGTIVCQWVGYLWEGIVGFANHANPTEGGGAVQTWFHVQEAGGKWEFGETVRTPVPPSLSCLNA